MREDQNYHYRVVCTHHDIWRLDVLLGWSTVNSDWDRHNRQDFVERPRVIPSAPAHISPRVVRDISSSFTSKSRHITYTSSCDIFCYDLTWLISSIFIQDTCCTLFRCSRMVLSRTPSPVGREHQASWNKLRRPWYANIKSNISCLMKGTIVTSLLMFQVSKRVTRSHVSAHRVACWRIRFVTGRWEHLCAYLQV